jgi:hypothetical protein
MRKLSTTGRLFAALAAAALLWCHGASVEAHAGSPAVSVAGGGVAAVHAPVPAPAAMPAPGCAFAAKGSVPSPGTALPTPTSAPDGALTAAHPFPLLLPDPPQSVRLAAGAAPYHASLFQQAVLIRI